MGRPTRIVLLHGLDGSSRAMRPLSLALSREGYEVKNLDYPSSRRPLQDLGDGLAARLRLMRWTGADVGFVAHSMGGLLVRAVARNAPDLRFGRSVFLGTPMQGATIARTLGKVGMLRRYFGPALGDLEPERARELPAPPCPVGIIAGSRRFPLLPSAWITRKTHPRHDSDSTVLVEETKFDDAQDHIVLPTFHSWLCFDREARIQTLAFLREGRFVRA